MASDNSQLIADALRKTSASLALSMDVEGTFASWVSSIGAKVSLYRNYERGEHRAGISDQMRKMLRLKDDGTGMTDFNDNYTQIVIDKMAGRLHVNEVSIGDPENEEAWLNPLLEYNNWYALQGTAFRGAIRDGDSYLMVDPDTLEWSSEPAYDGYSGVFALFANNSTTPYWAVKLWAEGGSDIDESMCLVVYEPDKISYWRGQENGGEIHPDQLISAQELQAQGVPIALPVGVDPATYLTNARPWPVSALPIVHIVNKYDNYLDFGESEIRCVIPLQDVLNRTLHSMVMASEFAAFNILWSIGMKMDPAGVEPGAVINLVLEDSAGNVIVEPTKEMLDFLNAVKVGQFTGTDIGQYINQIDKIVREISQVSQTPIYGITNTGGVSGEALKQLEIGLIGKCERFQRQNTDAVRDLVRITAKIQNTFKTSYEGEAPDIKTVNVAWKSPEILDVTAQIAVMVTMRRDAPGLWDDSFYQARIGGLLGMSQSDIKKEGDKALNATSDNIARLTSAGDGGIPVA